MFYKIPFLSNHLPLVVVVPVVHLLINRIAFPLHSLSCYSISLALTPLGTIYYTCSCLVTNSISLALTPLVCHSCFALTAWVIPQASSSGCWSRVLCRRPQSSLPGCRLTHGRTEPRPVGDLVSYRTFSHYCSTQEPPLQYIPATIARTRKGTSRHFT